MHRARHHVARVLILHRLIVERPVNIPEHARVHACGCIVRREQVRVVGIRLCRRRHGCGGGGGGHVACAATTFAAADAPPLLSLLRGKLASLSLQIWGGGGGGVGVGSTRGSHGDVSIHQAGVDDVVVVVIPRQRVVVGQPVAASLFPAREERASLASKLHAELVVLGRLQAVEEGAVLGNEHDVALELRPAAIPTLVVSEGHPALHIVVRHRLGNHAAISGHLVLAHGIREEAAPRKLAKVTKARTHHLVHPVQPPCVFRGLRERRLLAVRPCGTG
mmetsp:Transcript_2345/g.5785  ORF Transcript_2345/g.5785 Transcript_2345/m.5785 type:complete len:277 (-) Transcript_2345:1543-2373(-)